MNVITFLNQGNGTVWAEVRDGDATVYRTTEYVTERMAYADAYCWVAFHGGETKMTESLVKPGERFKAMGDFSKEVGTCWREFSAEHVMQRIATYAEHGVPAVRKTGPRGEYIEIGRNGSSYAQYHVMAADAPDSTDRNVMLTPNGVETKTRPELYGTPAYFGKVEWFDVVDRVTDELLMPWEVSRVDGKEVIVNGPKGLVITGLKSLTEAAEAIHLQRIS
ncbi:hypothetical protein HOS59_gp25 [Streptomyces phage Rowa]|uniref:Uncharacterized protein n=1 Tax=Streptomyces phage Rowa TaxID=2059883 RepID=A0A2H5BLT1_9CAUD|nr:hypothetical protein HOS59_gp25 [Streptomyces phage Rowa]AUG87289.1 hypothetical protein SEA_ROWA_25 [Streptomyces phage Rowa]